MVQIEGGEQHVEARLKAKSLFLIFFFFYLVFFFFFFFLFSFFYTHFF